MKLIVQIPCYNEEHTLSMVLKDIPNHLPGIDTIETQIIDDGSTDKTLEIARKLGVNHIIKNIGNKGLGLSFQLGIENALRQGAAILVNTDGDNQYPSSYIRDLVQPILQNEADIVVGNRQTATITHFSPLKRGLQWLGTKITTVLSGEYEVTDAVSGFRAYSRDALLQLNITSSFSYVLDSTIQASHKRIKMKSVPIHTNAPTRPSRLFKNIGQHVWRSGIDLVRIYSMYQPLKVFLLLGVLALFVGIVPIIRFLNDYFFGGGGTGMIQSLILGSVFVIISFNFFALGVIGDLLAKNRKLIEHILNKMK